jgi:hypothetical protein
MIWMALMIAGAEPSAEALALGREMAQAGMLATLLPILEADATEKLVADYPELSDADKAKLRDTAHRTAVEGRAKLLEADGRAYAEQLSVDDLRALVAFSRTDAAKNYRDAMPKIAASTMASAGPMDFKRDVIATYCKETGKLCPAQ